MSAMTERESGADQDLMDATPTKTPLTVIEGGKDSEPAQIAALLEEKFPTLMTPMVEASDDGPTADRVRVAINDNREEFLEAAARAYFGRKEVGPTKEVEPTDVNGADHLTAAFIYALKKIGVVQKD